MEISSLTKTDSVQKVMEDENKCLTFQASEGLQRPHLCILGVGGKPVLVSFYLHNNTAVFHTGTGGASHRERKRKPA